MEQDEALFCRFLDGEEDALSTLMDRYGNRLTLYINGIICDLHDAEDLMLEAFARIIFKRPKLVEHGFKPYLFKIGRNLALRYARKNRLHRHFGLEDMVQEAESAELVETVVQSGEQSRILHDCMCKLPPDYREVLYLLYFESLSYGQAAQIMKKSEKQIANLAYRGKVAMKPILEREGITHAQY
ncbi:MAG: RNA polymerase sigma factor [Oscillospiraceae bacterium]